MFSATWWTPYKGEVKTLRFHEDPRRKGLGNYTDVNGKRWHVFAIVGEHVNAREILPGAYNNYYGTDTAGYGFSGTQSFDPIHRWPPYKIEVVPRDEVASS